MDKKSILIAEDDLFLQQIYQRSLQAAGYTVDVAVNGKEALDKLAKGEWDLLLLDLNMPEISGMDVLQKMNQAGMLERTPVFVLTNFSEDEYKEKCKEMGAKEYFTKSNLSFDEILMKVKKIFSQRMQTDKLTAKSTAQKPVSKSTSSSPAAKDILEKVRASAEGTNTQVQKSDAAKILVVEDDPFLSEIYRQNFEERGYQVQTVSTGTKALAMLAVDQTWDIILLDLLMPDMDGFTVLEKLRDKKITEKIPVIVLTNLSQENDRKKVLELGAVDFAIKSELSFDEISALVENVLHKKSDPLS